MYLRVDFNREVDTKNKIVINNTIDLSKPNIVPHSWYYYLIGEKNVYYQSGPTPANLDRIVISPKEYIEEYVMGCYEYKYEKTVDDKIVYKVDRRKW